MEDICTSLKRINDTYYLEVLLKSIKEARNFGGDLSVIKLANNPVIYMGSHEEPITKIMDFSAYSFYRILSEKLGLDTPIIQLSSSVTCIQNFSRSQGPAFYQKKDRSMDFVFSEPSRNTLRDMSVGCLNDFKLTQNFKDYLLYNGGLNQKSILTLKESC